MPTIPNTAPYGSWKSPITSDLIVSQSISLSDVRFDGEALYWLEGRPQEHGRNVVGRAGEAGTSVTDVVPRPFNVRTRVHEYGGGAWTVAHGVHYFSHFADGRLYRLGPGESEPTPLTPAPPARDRQWRFAGGGFGFPPQHLVRGRGGPPRRRPPPHRPVRRRPCLARASTP